MQDILMFLVAIVTLSIVGIIVTTFLRRWLHEKRFSRLDRLKVEYNERLEQIMNSDNDVISSLQQEIKEDPLHFEALEETLLSHFSDNPHYLNTVERLGYIQKYQSILSSNTTTQRKALAADRIGRFRHNESVGLLEKCAASSITNTDLVNSIFKSLALIDTDDALKAIIALLPDVLRHHSISSKNAGMVLSAFSSKYLELLLEACNKYQEEQEKEAQLVILDAISRCATTSKSIQYCVDILQSEDAELCVRALRHLCNVPIEESFDLSQVTKMLSHPQWFVRVQAIRALKHRLNIDETSKYLFLLKDPSWQVRRNFAELLVSYKENALGSMVEIFQGDDNYAKEAIAEAIQMEGFFAELLGYITPKSFYYPSAKIIFLYLKKIGLVDLQSTIDIGSYPELTQQTITELLAEKENENA